MYSDSPRASSQVCPSCPSTSLLNEWTGGPRAGVSCCLSVKMPLRFSASRSRSACLAPSILTAAGTISHVLQVLQDTVDHAGRRNRHRGCGPAWRVPRWCRVTLDDLGRLWPSPAQRDPDPSPLAPRCRSMRRPSRAWDCCAVAAMPNRTHLVSPRPSRLTGRLAGWHPI